MDNALHTDKISWLVCFFFFASELAQRRSSLCRNNIYCHHIEPLSSPAVHTLRTNSVTASPSLDSSPKVTLLLCPLAECATTAAPSGPPAHRHRQHRLLLSLLKFRTMLSVLQNLPPIATTSPWQLFNCIIYTKRLVCMGKYWCGRVSISSRADQMSHHRTWIDVTKVTRRHQPLGERTQRCRSAHSHAPLLGSNSYHAIPKFSF